MTTFYLSMPESCKSCPRSVKISNRTFVLLLQNINSPLSKSKGIDEIKQNTQLFRLTQSDTLFDPTSVSYREKVFIPFTPKFP